MKVNAADYNALLGAVAGYRCALVLLVAVLITVCALWFTRSRVWSARQEEYYKLLGDLATFLADRAGFVRSSASSVAHPDISSNLVAVASSPDGVKHVTFPPLGDVEESDQAPMSDSVELDLTEGVQPDSYTLFMSRGVSGDGWLM